MRLLFEIDVGLSFCLGAIDVPKERCCWIGLSFVFFGQVLRFFADKL